MRVTINSDESSQHLLQKEEEEFSTVDQEIVFRSPLGIFLFPFLLAMFIARFMFFFTGWTIVTTGYIASLATAFGAALGFVLAWTNGSDAGASLLAGGCGLALMALCKLFFLAAGGLKNGMLSLGRKQ